MPRLSACIEMIFSHLPFPERIAAVASTGLPAFEFWGWQNKDVDAIAEGCGAHGLCVSAFSGINGGQIPLVDPAHRQRVVDAFVDSCRVAARLNCSTLIVTTGNELPGVPRAAQRNAVVEALRAIAPIAVDYDVVVALEPLNVRVDHGGYFLVTSDEGFTILQEVASPNVKLLYDVYHQQISEGYLTQTITEHAGRIGHIHVADTPGRHEPGTGEINYQHIFRAIDGIGYRGFVGLEFRPSGDHAASIAQTVRIAAS